MNICPITCKPCTGRYSEEGLKKLSRTLTGLNDFPFTAEEQIREAAARASKMSIQGVHPKLSAVLNIKKQVFEAVDAEGRFILKPQNPLWPQLPENEALSMHLAKAAGIEVPLHGLIYAKDGSLTYFIKRFDRSGKKEKLAVEDFSQLMGLSRDCKYDSSMEKVVQVVETFCTFPAVEKVKLFRVTVFSFLTGNEDMHLKNFSLFTQKGKIQLTPAYDLLNTSIVIGKKAEELALPLQGRKRKITREMLTDYFAGQRMGLSEKIISRVIGEIKAAFGQWDRLIDSSFLSHQRKQAYRDLLCQRKRIIFG